VNRRKVYTVQGGRIVDSVPEPSEPLPLRPPPRRQRNPLASTHTVATLEARIEDLTARLAAHTKPGPNRRTAKSRLKRARQLMRALTNVKPLEVDSAG
jgi:hypothetical protein